MFAYLTDRKFLYATALLVGTMVGVGIFGIPFVFAKSGFLIGLGWLIILAGITSLYNLIFAEVTLRTEGTHQISGYANIWLGPWARRLTFLANVLAGYGTLLAYMIIVGGFLHNVLSEYITIHPDWYGIIFAVAWSLLAMVRLRTVAVVDLMMMVVFGVTVLAIVIFGAPHIDWTHFQGVTWQYWFLPYGVLMFALAGANAVPMQRHLLAGRESLLRPAILTAVILVTLLYLIFAGVVVGVSGDITTPDALGGLYDVLGRGIIVLGSLFGIMTISTSFLMMSTALYETFHVDYKLPWLSSWLLVILPPVIFFMSGLRNFIDVIGLVGSVAVGILSIVVLAMWVASRKASQRTPEWVIPLPSWTVWLFRLIFIGGIIYALLFR
jgi:tyrosine-specific transport protein